MNLDDFGPIHHRFQTFCSHLCFQFYHSFEDFDRAYLKGSSSILTEKPFSQYPPGIRKADVSSFAPCRLFSDLDGAML